MQNLDVMFSNEFQIFTSCRWNHADRNLFRDSSLNSALLISNISVTLFKQIVISSIQSVIRMRSPVKTSSNSFSDEGIFNFINSRISSYLLESMKLMWSLLITGSFFSESSENKAQCLLLLSKIHKQY